MTDKLDGRQLIDQYEHHGELVYVMKHLRGKHRNHCLCHICTRFKPGMPETNCPTANLLYAVCLECGVTTPVYECPAFELRDVSIGRMGKESRDETSDMVHAIRCV